MNQPTTSERTPERAALQRRRRRAAAFADAASSGIRMLLLKIVVLAIIDALSVYAILALLAAGNIPVAVIAGILTLAINVIYLTPGLLPAKYLAPGLVFLLIYQIVVVGASGYIAFTNYGSGHNSSKEDAITALESQNRRALPDSPTYPLTVLEKDGEFFFLTSDPDTGEELLGGEDAPLAAAGDTSSYSTLDFSQLLERQSEITALTVPMSDDPTEGFLSTNDGSTGVVSIAELVYDSATDSMTNTTTGVVYTDNGHGSFESADGQQLATGWQAVIGFDNFIRAFTEESIRGPFFAVLAWTISFAALSVITTFLLGLVMAIIFNDPTLKSRRFYRVAMILPYAFPAFLSALVWAGLFNQQFGFINQVILGGASIPWLGEATLAKVSILLVNLWLGYPYMFLVCTGALQSLPDDVVEAGRMDGANVWQLFRHIKFPLLMVAVAPLLVSSFAFNFNNFGLIYLMTKGGPAMASADINVGHTDLLISMVYKVAFVGTERDYGLASAFSIIIFLFVAVISYIGFRQTKVLEELN